MGDRRKKISSLRAKTAIVAAAAAIAMSMPALAEEFTTSDSVLTIETPNDEWQQVADDSTWVTLADGNDRITMLHYSNGDELPGITIADDKYAQVCQNIISTRNEVFIITGSAADQADFQKVQQAVQSAVINKYDTKTAVQKVNGTSGNTAASSAQTKDGYTIEAVDEFVTYVMSSTLNIRSSYSTSASVLGTLYYADAVTVNGVVKQNGSDAGWYCVDYNGATGYIASQYTNVGGPTAENSGITLTDEQVTLYALDGSGSTYINKGTDGKWYDGYGRQYTSDGTSLWICQNDKSEWSDYAPDTSFITDNSTAQVTIVDKEGLNYDTLYENAKNGEWYNVAGGLFIFDGTSQWTAQDGSLWYTAQ
ncbi:MAG: SH3 domain-containing protein [Lachnospiraceae bacterium]|nr:SH3 domain-containing protein [Lachnospiraceae bacterium]